MKTFLTLVTLFCGTAYAMIGGSSASDSAYDAVGQLGEIGYDGGCTATLISDEWIVTAKHCREGGSEGEPFLYEPADLEFRSAGETYTLDQWVDAPEGGDIAFLHLSEPLTSIKEIPISVSGWRSKSGHLEAVGFGYESEDGFGSENGKRKKAVFSVTSTSGNALINIFKTKSRLRDYLKRFHPGEEGDGVEMALGRADVKDGYTIHAWDPRGRSGLRFEMPEGGWSDTCNGDSGGPLLHVENGKLELTGTVSSGFNGAVTACLPLGTIFSIFGPEVVRVMDANGIPYSK